MLCDDILGAVGRTPLVELRHCSPKPGVRLFAKLEGHNPSGSVKDRIAREMVLAAERDGRLEPGSRIVVASTGNTGISLAMVGRARGYQVRVVVPENIAEEIPPCLAAFGARIEWVPAVEGMRSAIAVARRWAESEGEVFLDQFADPYNTQAHCDTTGPEILADLPHVDVFVAGLGTGGTLMGVGERLKDANPDTQIVAAEPHPGSQLQGLRSLAEGFVPPILDLEMLDGKILVGSRDAFRAAAEVMRREGIFAGISSGAVLHAAHKVARRLPRGDVVLLFADSGWKYLKTELWTNPPGPDDGDEWDETLWW